MSIKLALLFLVGLVVLAGALPAENDQAADAPAASSEMQDPEAEAVAAGEISSDIFFLSLFSFFFCSDKKLTSETSVFIIRCSIYLYPSFFMYYTPTQPILVYSLVLFYPSFFMYYTPTQPILVYSLVLFSVIRCLIYLYPSFFMYHTPTQPILVYSLVLFPACELTD
jgi:hypothetical protein